MGIGIANGTQLKESKFELKSYSSFIHQKVQDLPIPPGVSVVLTFSHVARAGY
jgi:hypothetical protein